MTPPGTSAASLRPPGLLALGLCLACGCSLLTPFRAPPASDVDAGGDTDVEASPEADVESADDGGGDADVDDDRPATPGPVTLVTRRIVMSKARLCDLDGDGDLDNAIADLGPTADPLVVALGAIFNDAIAGGQRLLAHLPRVDDVVHLDDDEAVLIMFEGIPIDPTVDDFSGGQTYWVDGWCVDLCGEPRFLFHRVRLESGSIEGEDGLVPLPGERLEISRRAHVWGGIVTDGPGASLTFCAAAVARDIGAGPGPDLVGDLTLLETFLAGGAAAGAPMVPGVDLDLDLDRDGLERIELDEHSQIARCIDGDMTVIEGRECWQDPRIQDAFSFVVTWEMTTALIDGLEPRWRDLAPEDSCDGGPPDGSLWDPR